MQLHRQSLCLIVPLLLAMLHGCLAGDDFFSDIKKTLTGETKTGVNVNLGDDSAKIGVKTDDGNPFYAVECSAGISVSSGFGAGCYRVWKPLFYVCIAGGAVVALLLLSCCCCCCCAPCRRKRAGATYFPVMNQSTGIVVVNPQAPGIHPPGYDVAMLHA